MKAEAPFSHYYNGLTMPRRIFVIVGAVVLILVFLSLHASELPRSPRLPLSSFRDNVDNLKDTANATLGFGQIFVIGLASRPDRRDRFTLGAGLSGLQVKFVDGAIGDKIPEKSVPVGKDGNHVKGGGLGCWRSHMDVLQKIVQNNISTALIMEDDADWDVRIRDQLRDMALSTRALIQPLKDQPGRYADPTYPKPPRNAPQKIPDFDFHNLPETVNPSVSPYGDGWDLLWLGNCGVNFPKADNKHLPKGRVIHRNDVTVAPKKNLWSFAQPFHLVDDYPEHTRAVSFAQDGVCTLAYAISQRGAQRILREIGLKPVVRPVDLALASFCNGDLGESQCLGVNPTLFAHHRTVGPLSAGTDIGDHGEGYRDKAFSDIVRYSVMINSEVIMNGSTNYIDQFPDPPSQ